MHGLSWTHVLSAEFQNAWSSVEKTLLLKVVICCHVFSLICYVESQVFLNITFVHAKDTIKKMYEGVALLYPNPKILVWLLNNK